MLKTFAAQKNHDIIKQLYIIIRLKKYCYTYNIELFHKYLGNTHRFVFPSKKGKKNL